MGLGIQESEAAFLNKDEERKEENPHICIPI